MKHALTFIVSLLCLLAPSAVLHAEQPNIILVMPDDVGYGDYACLGKPWLR